MIPPGLHLAHFGTGEGEKQVLTLPYNMALIRGLRDTAQHDAVAIQRVQNNRVEADLWSGSRIPVTGVRCHDSSHADTPVTPRSLPDSHAHTNHGYAQRESR